MQAARPTISEIFGRAALASGAVFRVIYLFLAVARLLDGTHRLGTENQNLSEFIDWPYLFTEMYAFTRDSAVCTTAQCRLGTEIRNLSESIRLAVFWSRAVLYIDYLSGCTYDFIYLRDLSLFDSRCNYFEERVDSRRRTKIFQNL